MSEEPKKVYKPQGKCRDVLYANEERIIAVGPAGTGKTRVIGTKVYLRAEKYPGSRHLICRQTRKSCTDTCLVSWENDVLPQGHRSLGKIRRENRHSYLFPNGSEVVVGGLDDPNKLFSSEWDTIWINESIEVGDEAVEILATRLRHGKCKFHQLILDTNPGPPTHYQKEWIDKKQIAYYPTTHKDNARYWDEAKGEWTEEGKRYLEDVLSRMTGARYTRLFLGEWSTPEGSVFPMLDPRDLSEGGHRFNARSLWPQGIPEWATKWVSIDHGTGSPYAGLWHLADREGNVYTFREDYGAGYPADVQAERVVQRSPANELYYAVYLDPSMKDQDAHARGKIGREISAAEIYEDRFARHNKEREEKELARQFGPVMPGTRVTRQHTIATLQKLLNRDNGHPNWYISYDCENLWKELMGAVYKKIQVTGLYVEDIDDKCPDHAITCAGYGLHTHYQLPKENPKSVLENFDHAAYQMNLRRQQLEDSENEFINATRADIRI